MRWAQLTLAENDPGTFDRRSGDWIEVTVPSILEHEVVAIEV